MTKVRRSHNPNQPPVDLNRKSYSSKKVATVLVRHRETGRVMRINADQLDLDVHEEINEEKANS